MKGGRALPEATASLPSAPAQPLTEAERAEVQAELDEMIANYATSIQIPHLPNEDARARRRQWEHWTEREIGRLEELLSW